VYYMTQGVGIMSLRHIMQSSRAVYDVNLSISLSGRKCCKLDFFRTENGY